MAHVAFMHTLPSELVDLVLAFVRGTKLLVLRHTSVLYNKMVVSYLMRHRSRHTTRVISDQFCYDSREVAVDQLEAMGPPPFFVGLEVWRDNVHMEKLFVKIVSYASKICLTKIPPDKTDNILQLLQSSVLTRPNSDVWLTLTTLTNKMVYLKNATKLVLEECCFDSLASLESLEDMTIRNCEIGRQLETLASCERLKRLRLVDMYLAVLNLKSATLQRLELSSLTVKDISPLKTLESLNTLVMYECDCIEDFSPLMFIRNVTIELCGDFDATFPYCKETATLESLSISFCPNVISLKHLPVSIIHLEVEYCCNLKTLSGLHPGLQEFHLTSFKDQRIDLTGLHTNLAKLSFVGVLLSESDCRYLCNVRVLELDSKSTIHHEEFGLFRSLKSQLVFPKLVSLVLPFQHPLLWDKDPDLVGMFDTVPNTATFMQEHFPCLEEIKVIYDYYLYEYVKHGDMNRNVHIRQFQIPSPRRPDMFVPLSMREDCEERSGVSRLCIDEATGKHVWVPIEFCFREINW